MKVPFTPSSRIELSMPSIGFVLASGFLLIFLALLYQGVKMMRTELKLNRRSSDKFFLSSLLAGISGVIAVIITLSLFPYAPEHHTKVLHTGTVSKVEARVVTDGSDQASLTREIAFWFEGETEAYLTSDVRLTSLEVGNTLTVRRQAAWVYAGEDYWKVTYDSAPTS